MGGESRSIDQLRADVALDLLTDRHIAAAEGGKRGSVNIHVDLTTLAHLDDNPADLAGYGPITSEVARRVAEAQEKSTWDAVVAGPETGEPLHVVSVKRRPTTKQQNMVRALHPTCVFPPGCRMPALNCDLDHRIDHAHGGPTTVGNHAPLCRRHHRAKHEGGWGYIKIGRAGIEWVSPLGHRYRTGGNQAGGRSPP